MSLCAATFRLHGAKTFILITAAALAACATTAGVSPSAPDALVLNAQTTLNNFLRDPDQTWVQQNDRSREGGR